MPTDAEALGRIDVRRRKPRRAKTRVLGIVVFCLALWAGAGEARAQSVQVILGPGLEEVMIDRELLRAIFTMRVRAWPGGPPVRVFVLPDSDPLSDRFYREHLGMYSYVLRAAWDRMVFTGTGFAPTIVRSEAEMRELVGRTPGAIGYVSKSGTSFRTPGSLQMASAWVPLK